MDDKLLLADGSSKLLLADGSSFLLLEVSAAGSSDGAASASGVGASSIVGASTSSTALSSSGTATASAVGSVISSAVAGAASVSLAEIIGLGVIPNPTPANNIARTTRIVRTRRLSQIERRASAAVVQRSVAVPYDPNDEIVEETRVAAA